MRPGCLMPLDHEACPAAGIPIPETICRKLYTRSRTAQCDDGHRVQVCAGKDAKLRGFYGIFCPPVL
jgi:hypothetical protein